MTILENLTIMFTDIVGFSDLVAKLSRAQSKILLEKHDRILNRIIKQFGGKTIKSIGDSFLVVFRSPTDAVLCGMAMQDALWEENQDEEQIPIFIRVAINTGEVRLTKYDVFGDAVNIASRVEQITPPNMVYLTESVYLSMSKSEVKLDKIDSFNFKGVTENINVYQASLKPQTNEIQTKLNQTHVPEKNSNHPYGGAHLCRKAHNSFARPIGKWMFFLVLITAIIFATWWLTIALTPAEQKEKILVEYRQPATLLTPISEIDILSPDFIVTSQLKIKASALLLSNDYIGLEKLIETHKKQYLNNAYFQLISAHADTYFKRYKNAILNYQQAFVSDPSLSSDKLAARNIVLLIEKERSAANKLIAKNLSLELIKNLSKRTGQQGLTGRYDAFYLLKDSGNTQAIDLVGLNIWDLRELKKCQLKKIAVIELKRLKNKRGLTALKEIFNVGFLDRLKYACLRKDAKEAITLIEAE